MITQKICWDKVPSFCTDCRHVGHLAATCYAFGKKEKPPKKDFTKASQQGMSHRTEDLLRGSGQLPNPQVEKSKGGDQHNTAGGGKGNHSRPKHNGQQPRQNITGYQDPPRGEDSGTGDEASDDTGFQKQGRKWRRKSRGQRRREKQRREARQSAARGAEQEKDQRDIQHTGSDTAMTPRGRQVGSTRGDNNGEYRTRSLSPSAMVHRDKIQFEGFKSQAEWDAHLKEMEAAHMFSSNAFDVLREQEEEDIEIENADGRPATEEKGTQEASTSTDVMNVAKKARRGGESRHVSHV